MPDWLSVLGSIILVDLVLSGDNALVIGAVAAGIPVDLRWIAFIVGGGTAVVVRILLTYSVTLLLKIPYIEMLAGIILIVITTQLLLKRDDEDTTSQEVDQPGHKRFLKKNNIWGAIFTIIIADITMSLDNVIAVAALATYQPVLLIVGLLISIGLLLIGSALISFLISRLAWLMPVAAIILAITAANMIIRINDVFNILPNEQPWWPLLIYIIVFAGIIIFVAAHFGWRWWHNHRSHPNT